jgi:hypothetical protein
MVWCRRRPIEGKAYPSWPRSNKPLEQQVGALVISRFIPIDGDDTCRTTPELNNRDPFSDPPSVQLFTDSSTDTLESVEVTTLQSGTTGGWR